MKGFLPTPVHPIYNTTIQYHSIVNQVTIIIVGMAQYNQNPLNCICCDSIDINQYNNSDHESMIDEISSCYSHPSTTTPYKQSLNVHSYPIQYMTLLHDQSTLVYKGRAVHKYDAAPIILDQPVLTTLQYNNTFSYIEVELLEYDMDVHIHSIHECNRHSGPEHTSLLNNALNIGITQYKYDTADVESNNVSIGTSEHSIALQCNTHKLIQHKTIINHSNSNKIHAMSTGDLFGVGYNCLTRHVFFTINGELYSHQHDVTEYTDQPLYLCLSLHGTGMRCRVNTNGNYKFNLQQYTKQQQADTVKQIKHTAVSQTTQINIVRNYLLHNGYLNTLQLFDNVYGKITDDNSNTHSMKLNSTLQQRHLLRQSIECGDIDTSIEIVHELLPNLLTEDRNINFALNCCKFIQLLRNDNTTAALQHMKKTVQACQPMTPQQQQHLQHCMSLLAQYNIHDEYLLTKQYLIDLADLVNSTILQHTQCDTISNLALIKRQLHTTQFVLQSADTMTVNYHEKKA